MHQAEQVLHAGLDGEVIHFIVQEEAGARCNHHGAEAAVDGVGSGNRVAILVDDRVMGGFWFLMRRHARLHFDRWRGLVGADLFADRGSVFLAQQAVQRILDECRVAQEGVAIHVRVTHRFGHVVHCRRRMEAQRLHVVALKDVEDLAHGGAAGAWWWCGNEYIAAVVARQRCAFADLVTGEVGCGNDAAASLGGAFHGCRDGAFIESVRAVARDGFQRLGQILLHQAIARLQWCAVAAQEQARSFRVFLELGDGGVEDVGVAAVQDVTVARQLDRRLHHLGARQLAVFALRGVESEHGARHAGCQVAEQAGVGDRLAVGVQVHIGAGRSGRGFTEIDEGIAAVGQVDGHEAATADIAAARIDHRLRITDRNRGINRIAAHLQDVDADLRSQMLRSHHHAILRLDCRRRSRQGVAQQAQQQRRCG